MNRFDQELADTIEGERLRRHPRTRRRPWHDCPYCGRPTVGEACRAHADLPALDRAPRDRVDPGRARARAVGRPATYAGQP